jgi:hypothetical protein
MAGRRVHGGRLVLRGFGRLCGLVFLFVNPLAINFLMGSGNIDEVIRKLASIELMMVYLPIFMVVNGGVFWR